MTQRSPNPVEAGSLLLATIIVCALLGLGAAALLDVTWPLLAGLGVVAGFVLGLTLVRTRYRDI